MPFSHYQQKTRTKHFAILQLYILPTYIIYILLVYSHKYTCFLECWNEVEQKKLKHSGKLEEIDFLFWSVIFEEEDRATTTLTFLVLEMFWAEFEIFFTMSSTIFITHSSSYAFLTFFLSKYVVEFLSSRNWYTNLSLSFLPPDEPTIRYLKH